LINFSRFDRGKALLGHSDAELSSLGGYDLVHFDDLAYVASAHQEREWTHFYPFSPFHHHHHHPFV
jgi:hypothetical protein